MAEGNENTNSRCWKSPKCTSTIIVVLQIITVIILAIGVILAMIYLINPLRGPGRDDTGTFCRSNPCKNGGTCSESGSTYVCQCTANHLGRDCESYNPCAVDPCQNGGNCSISGKAFVCVCPTGYSGHTCEKAKYACLPNPCNNGGTCTQVASWYLCMCPKGYIGITCEKDDPCIPNPCRNSGNCSTSGNNFHCACPVAKFGRICEIDQTREEDYRKDVLFSKLILGFVVPNNAILIGVLVINGIRCWRRKKY